MSQTITAAIAPATAPNTRPKISFAGVNKFYGDNRARTATTLALDDFDLDIAPEEIVSIVGPTGCGKSTALNLLAGFEHPSSGIVSVDGQAVTDPGPNRGVVFQQPSLFPWLTVLSNVVLGIKCRGVAIEGEGEAIFISDRQTFSRGGRWVPEVRPCRGADQTCGPAAGIQRRHSHRRPASLARICMQRPTFSQQLDPASALSLTSKEGGLAGKLQLATQVLHATKSIPEPVPISVIQNAIDPSHLKAFAASDRAKQLRQISAPIIAPDNLAK